MDRSQFIQTGCFLAALLVVVTHATFYAHDRLGGALSVWHFGEVGVPIFFVISGLVMVISCRSLSSDGSGSVTFLARRFIRIVPLYWLVTLFKIAVAVFLPSAVNHNHFQPDHAVKSLLFIPYFNSSGEVRPMHGVGWTLLHEVFFYLLFAASMLLGRWRDSMVIGAICILWMVGGFIDEKSAFEVVVTNSVNFYFVLGVVVGNIVLKAEVSGWPRIPFVTALTIGAILVSFWSQSWAVVFLFSASVVICYHSRWPLLNIFSRLGDSSYSLYLFHPIIAPAIVVASSRYLGVGPEMAVIFAVVVAVLTSHLLHISVEKPVVAFAKARVSIRTSSAST